MILVMGWALSLMWPVLTVFAGLIHLSSLTGSLAGWLWNGFTNVPGGRQATHWSNKAPSMWPLSLWQPCSGRSLWAQGSKQQDSQLQYPSTLPACAHTGFAKVRLASASHLVKHMSAVEKQTPLLNGRMRDIIRVWAWMQRREETFFFPPPLHYFYNLPYLPQILNCACCCLQLIEAHET